MLVSYVTVSYSYNDKDWPRGSKTLFLQDQGESSVLSNEAFSLEKSTKRRKAKKRKVSVRISKPPLQVLDASGTIACDV